MVFTRSQAERRTWRKILYEDQGVPDNYTDESFLDELRKNVHTKTYKYWHVVLESLIVTGQMCSICLFVVVYVYMSYDILSPIPLLYILAFSTILGYLLNYIIVRHTTSLNHNHDSNSSSKHDVSVMKDVGSLLVFVCFGWFFSPILHTLTDTISTDTIYAMASVMLLANLAFHDYGPQAAIVSRAISLNTVIFAAVCLSSRLPTSLHTFTLISLVIQVFGLWPQLRLHIKELSVSVHLVVSVMVCVATLTSLASLSVVAACLYLSLLLLTTFLAPACLIHLQPLKDTLHGPWDEVQPQFHS